MVFVFYKVAALILKVFTKPLMEYTKRIHLGKQAKQTNPFIRKKLIEMGNKYNKFDQWINQKFLKINSQFAYKPLNDELAIQKGINFFYQIMFYVIIISIPLYQLNRSSKQSKLKSKKLEENIKNLETRYDHILRQIQIQQNNLKQKRLIEHCLPKLDGKKTTDCKCKIQLKFPDKKTHVYHIDYLL